MLTPGSRYAVGKIKHGDTPELTLYAAPLEALGTPGDRVEEDLRREGRGEGVHRPRRRHLPDDGRGRAALPRGPHVARRSRTSFGGPGEVIPESERVVESIAVAQDALYVGLLDGGLSVAGTKSRSATRGGRIPATPSSRRSRSPRACRPATPSAPSPTSTASSSAPRRGRGPARIYAYDPAAGALKDTGLTPLGKFDNPEGYVSREVRVTSHDGVQVPLSIVHKAGLKLDGSNPTLVDGYGSYGMTMYAHFDPKTLAWLERGGVLAVAHVRGGGEFGKQWHLAGRMATKPNTWKDFIACCEYLVREGYTSPAKLTGEGTSAGGILIGRAITERPDLFAAAIVNVGCTDTVRAETTTNGVPNIKEFGTVTTKEGFDALLAMSPYHHVQPGTKYPAVLLIHGVNDPRVDPWMSAKLTARLQAATTSGKPVLFRVDYQAGHGIGSTKTQRQEQLADEWSFLAVGQTQPRGGRMSRVARPGNAYLQNGQSPVIGRQSWVGRGRWSELRSQITGLTSRPSGTPTLTTCPLPPSPGETASAPVRRSQPRGDGSAHAPR